MDKVVDVRRYVVVQTIISMLVNVVLDAGPAAVTLSLAKAGPRASTHSFIWESIPQLVFSGLMSALVPVLLTRHRHRSGRLWARAHGLEPTLVQVGLVAVALMALSGGIGAAFLAMIFPRVAGASPSAAAMLLFYGLYGAAVAVIVTPLALVFLYGRTWSVVEHSSGSADGVRH